MLNNILEDFEGQPRTGVNLFFLKKLTEKGYTFAGVNNVNWPRGNANMLCYETTHVLKQHSVVPNGGYVGGI